MHYLSTRTDFKKVVSSLTKALCLTIALGAPTAVFANTATTPATPPVEAPVEAPECNTPDKVLAIILEVVPDVEVKSVSPEPPYVMVLTSPSKQTDLVITFDENNCAVSATEKAKDVPA